MRWWRRFSASPSREASVDPGRRIYAIGDIHGRVDLLDKLLKQIAEHADEYGARRKTLVFLGDYIDRGRDSKGVIDRLLKIDLPGWNVVFLRGNHEQSLLDFFGDANVYRVWKNFGAAETLISYGVKPPRFERESEFADARDQLAAVFPPAHLAFLQSLALYYSQGDYFFCHAGVRPGITLERQVPQDLLWIRDEFLNSQKPFEKVIVHGHTPTIEPVKTPFRIGIDTGAHATNCLTAAVLEHTNCSFLQTTNHPAPLTAEAYI